MANQQTLPCDLKLFQMCNVYLISFNSSSKKTTAHGINRSQSSERPAVMQSWMASTPGQVMPNQPFAQDPSMPLPTPPNTTVQLEEAKRRLEESRTVPVKSK